MTQAEYIDLILNGYFNHRDYLAAYFYRECKKAEEKHIGCGEFLQRLTEANMFFLEDIKLRSFKERKSWELAKANRKAKGTWTEDWEKASAQVLGFSAHLFSLTNGRWPGKLNVSDLEFIQQAIIKAIDKIEAEKMPVKVASNTLPDKGEPGLKPKMILLALWQRDGRITDEEKLEKKRAGYLEIIAKIKGASAGHRNDFSEFKQFATNSLPDGKRKTFEKYLYDIQQPKYKEQLRKHNLI